MLKIQNINKSKISNRTVVNNTFAAATQTNIGKIDQNHVVFKTMKKYYKI